jgi:xylan 1,4-beta-xylosidase
MRTNTRFVLLVVLLLTLLHRASAQGASTPKDFGVVVIDATAPAHPLPHFWEQMFGSERAIVTLRESYRNDLRDVKKIYRFRIRALSRHLS